MPNLSANPLPSQLPCRLPATAEDSQSENSARVSLTFFYQKVEYLVQHAPYWRRPPGEHVYAPDFFTSSLDNWTLMSQPTESLASVLEALLEVPNLAAQLRRNIEIAEALFRPEPEKSLPPGVRLDIGRITAALALAPSFAELMKFADIVDLRDLNETELAYIEGLSLKTVRRWRTQGTGPEYRCESGISYPIRWVWEWREKGRQRLTAQKKTRGWRE